MLVLTRKLGEGVNIGRDVEIVVVGVGSGKVKLGFRAPRDVVIQRTEVPSRVSLDEEGSHPQDQVPNHQVLARIDSSEFLVAPPLRSFRRLESA
jgi:carbon storage regulator